MVDYAWLEGQTQCFALEGALHAHNDPSIIGGGKIEVGRARIALLISHSFSPKACTT